MSNKPFIYQNPFPLAHDDTEYYLLTKEHVSVAEFDGQEMLKVGGSPDPTGAAGFPRRRVYAASVSSEAGCRHS